MANFDKDDTYNKIIEIMVEKLGIEKDRIQSVATFEELGADSLDMVEVIMKLEEQFGLEIKDEDAENMKTMDDVVLYIQERRTR